MSHHSHDITVILTNRRDNYIKLADLLNKSGVKLDKKQVEAIHNFDLKRIEKQDGEDARMAREELTSISEYLLLTASSNEASLDNEEYLNITSNIDELDKVYRQHLMMYIIGL